ncbi:MAG: TerB family tellurite resistance protein [Gammaproteobacteria bacterium]|nr:TerB family tellurite resistance protein [Gammaproteobacteria bacterium]
MLNNIRDFFQQRLGSISGGRDSDSPEKALQLATASLLIEISRADYHVAPAERKAITTAVRSFFGLSEQETAELVQLAESEMEGATCLYEFTRLVDTHFSYDQKIKVIENLWRVAYADAAKHHYEEHLVRKIADLLHVSHKDFIRTRHVVEQATN